MTVRIGKTGEFIERPGRRRWISLPEQKVHKQNFLRVGLMGTEKGINWHSIEQADKIEALAYLPHLSFSYFKPTMAEEMPDFRINGDIEVLNNEELEGFVWEAQNHPQLLLNKDFEGNEGLFFAETEGLKRIIDAALILTFPKSIKANRGPFHFGIPLDFPAGRHADPISEPTSWFSHFKASFPVFPNIFPTLPDKMDVSLGIVHANLERMENEDVYMAANFRARLLARFPSLPLRDLQRIKDLAPR